MRVLGRDTTREAYLVAVENGSGTIRAWLPENLIAASRPAHQVAYEWIATKHKKIETAILAKAAGRAVPAQYERIELAKET